MSQLINEPTRITESSRTLIDVFFSTHPHNISLTKVIQLGISAHFIKVGCVRKMNSLRFQARTIKCHSYKKYNKQAFNKDLKMASWVSELKSSDINSAWNGFKSIFLDICDRHAPLLPKKVRGYQNPRMTSAISTELDKNERFLLNKIKEIWERRGLGFLSIT